LADRLSAVRVAIRVQGVRAIADDIETRSALAEEHSDAEIAAAAANGLRDHAGLHGCEVKPVVYSGKVVLSGEVDKPEQRDLAEKLVEHLAGVKYVLSDIKIAGATLSRASETSARI
jgi:osmotically-inducible protein OsmY